MNSTEILKRNLAELRSSEYLSIPIFNDLFKEAKKHEQHLNVAHLMKRTNDKKVLNSTETNFYLILTKMLTELKNCKEETYLMNDLNKIYDWYLKNRKSPKYGEKDSKLKNNKLNQRTMSREIINKSTFLKTPNLTNRHDVNNSLAIDKIQEKTLNYVDEDLKANSLENINMNELDNQQQQQLPLKQSLAQQINPYVDYSKQKFDINRQTPYYTLNKSRLSNKSRSQPNTRLSKRDSNLLSSSMQNIQRQQQQQKEQMFDDNTRTNIIKALSLYAEQLYTQLNDSSNTHLLESHLKNIEIFYNTLQQNKQQKKTPLIVNNNKGKELNKNKNYNTDENDDEDDYEKSCNITLNSIVTMAKLVSDEMIINKSRQSKRSTSNTGDYYDNLHQSDLVTQLRSSSMKTPCQTRQQNEKPVVTATAASTEAALYDNIQDITLCLPIYSIEIKKSNKRPNSGVAVDWRGQISNTSKSNQQLFRKQATFTSRLNSARNSTNSISNQIVQRPKTTPTIMSTRVNVFEEDVEPRVSEFDYDKFKRKKSSTLSHNRPNSSSPPKLTKEYLSIVSKINDEDQQKDESDDVNDTKLSEEITKKSQKRVKIHTTPIDAKLNDGQINEENTLSNLKIQLNNEELKELALRIGLSRDTIESTFNLMAKNSQNANVELMSITKIEQQYKNTIRSESIKPNSKKYQQQHIYRTNPSIPRPEAKYGTKSDVYEQLINIKKKNLNKNDYLFLEQQEEFSKSQLIDDLLNNNKSKDDLLSSINIQSISPSKQEKVLKQVKNSNKRITPLGRPINSQQQKHKWNYSNQDNNKEIDRQLIPIDKYWNTNDSNDENKIINTQENFEEEIDDEEIMRIDTKELFKHQQSNDEDQDQEKQVKDESRDNTDVQKQQRLKSISKARLVGTSLSLGRPIPTEKQIEDPEKSKEATEIYNESRRSVYIPSIFKGSIVRNYAKELSAEERLRKENKIKAAILIQTNYRKHLARKRAIQQKSVLTPEKVEWEKNLFRQLEQRRLSKQEQLKNQRKRIEKENKAFKESVSQIGMHVDMYQMLVKKPPDYTRETLNAAATCIQKWYRGYSIRKRLKYLQETLKRRGIDWRQFTKKYRLTIKRIQKLRKMPKMMFEFDIDEALDFVKNEKKYSSIFDKLAYGQTLDYTDLEKFFNYCDLFPTHQEIHEAKEAVMKVNRPQNTQAFSKIITFEILYYIYPPLGTKLKSTRQSTWLNSRYNNEDALKNKSSLSIEKADFKKVWDLVCDRYKEDLATKRIDSPKTKAKEFIDKHRIKY